MPTISVDKAALFKELGREYTTEEFDELCFEFGIELDEDVLTLSYYIIFKSDTHRDIQTTDQDRPIVDGVQEPPQLKIEIPANRYDLLCIEGIQLMLNIFLGGKPLPEYKLSQPADGQLQEIIVKEDTTKIRPYVSGAILRGVKFDKARYESFIALQDKLHQNLARQRSLVAIGTHDLDTIKGPFTYEALPPKDIKFTPLNQTQEMDGEELMTFYEALIYDSNRTVCSLPPIINGDHSKISMDTTNIFIEMTATDRTKLEIVNRMMVTMFSQYTSEPFTIEPVKIVSEHNNETRITPDIAPRVAQAEVSYINQCCGLNLSAAEISTLLKKMSFRAKPSTNNPDTIDDVAIAYGFNKLPRSFPSKSGTIAQPLAINKLSDVIRIEAAMAGWSEVLPLILCSHDENFAWLNRKDDGNTAPSPGLLKTIRENKAHSLPMKIFEVSDVAFKDLSLERKSRNERHFAAAWYGRNSGFEIVHGLMDRVMAMLKSAFITGEETLDNPAMNDSSYYIKELDDPTYFPGHAASVHLRIGNKDIVVGSFGILHPTVLEKYDLKNPVSTLEINIEPFL
ncbi:Phenylalanine--tRNA ligase beta subunit [Penicillium hetheringtonii]|uniref:phenylalanine--tRNA ligase n=1 Tax=Penicillium hetheringtonii TaxID=911720 RepID=A0AAD6E4E5_9EURO|nr:Phenylalanine--tRNA ligase beta subunit [Penicillium hetheringtonii]